VDRGRVAAIEDGATGRSSSCGALEAALSRLEEEMSGPYDNGDGRLVTFELTGNSGVSLTVKGPVEHVEVLRAQVERLIETMSHPPVNDDVRRSH
jgi:hypothetical protein